MLINLEQGLSPGLMSLSPPHGLGTRGCHVSTHGMWARQQGQAQHPSRQSFGTTRRIWPECRAGSHLGSTLNPGGAVLTLGVFRRSGSVACVRVDASPNEVLTQQIVRRERRRVKQAMSRLQQFTHATGSSH